jgi:FSR family fosmidomycin resistance protein-like MFS transporter
MTRFVLILLVIELLDELVYGAGEAAWPLIRDDLLLNYVQIGLLQTLPRIIGTLIEPFIGILGDTNKRRLVILSGGVCFTLSLLLTGVSGSFAVLLFSFILFNPASGAFVGLAQAALMDHEPTRHEQNMARWTLAGSLGVLGGTLLLGAVIALGGSWRTAFPLLAGLAFVLVVLVSRYKFPAGQGEDGETMSFMQSLRGAFEAMRRRDVLRWLVLLQFSDLMLDILLGFLALYFVDVAGVSESEAGIAVAVWVGVGLLGDALLIPLLERVRGLDYLRFSAVLEGVLFIALLLAEPLLLKLIILGAHGFFNAGWYSILQGQLYTAMLGQSGTVMAVGTLTGLIGGLLPLLIGLVAQQAGLGVAMWLLLAGPLALLVGLPRNLIPKSPS